MALFQTRWEARFDHDRRRVTVLRNEWTKGLTLIVDDERIASRPLSLVGTGRLVGLLPAAEGGEPLRVEVRVKISGCEITVNGQSLPVREVA